MQTEFPKGGLGKVKRMLEWNIDTKWRDIDSMSWKTYYSMSEVELML